MTLKENVLELLKRPETIDEYGIELYDICRYFERNEREIKSIINELKREKMIVAIPFKQGYHWYLKYYFPPHNEIPIYTRIEEIFTELAIPPWIKTRVFRGANVIFIGDYNKKPGFTIIDYSESPPLIFHNKLAGGNRKEIINYKKKSKYRCEKEERIVWYNYNGKKVSDNRSE